ncbi:MAG TPA: hypothetical protein VGV37_06355 [Aliidongia sp.]|uniref:hypothetical protein n=1 Tax=Aliidongia sp. TaxID=1914230 RepID=UPI002DDCD282|nr:hypothetical protein [Aliidongia sp.]HEV2674147.1 hypothetical protein [Aliidongia sp.]
MGIPAGPGISATGTKPAGDKANAVLSGIIAGVGPTAPFAFVGPFNALIWGSINTALTTTAGSNAATVVSGTGLAIGQTINSVNVPSGTTILTVTGTAITMAFPPVIAGSTALATALGGTDALALFNSTAWAGTINLERSFDGGSTWLTCNIGGSGTAASYIGATQAGVPVSLTVAEPERQVLYRWNCVAYASGVINFRISETGAAATGWGIIPT